MALATLAAACARPDPRPVRVVIPSGSSFTVAAESLRHAGVIAAPRFFRFYAGLTGRDRALKAGTYEFKPGTSYGDLIDALTRGRGIVHTVTIPEGWELTTIAAALAKSLGVPAESVLAAASDTALRHRLDVPTESIEGYLFPDTYQFADGTPAREAVRTMVVEFEKRWRPEWTTRLTDLAMSRHDVITLASIIEKEAKLAEERPVISAVYQNRLKAGMLLQADPTVQYALGRHVGRVLNKDLETDSRYNTYRHLGLPPGPIASPGVASIQAALYPADVPYLYFVAHPDGHHEFRRTFAEHSAAIRDIRRDRQAIPRRNDGR